MWILTIQNTEKLFKVLNISMNIYEYILQLLQIGELILG